MNMLVEISYIHPGLDKVHVVKGFKMKGSAKYILCVCTHIRAHTCKRKKKKWVGVMDVPLLSLIKL